MEAAIQRALAKPGTLEDAEEDDFAGFSGDEEEEEEQEAGSSEGLSDGPEQGEQGILGEAEDSEGEDDDFGSDDGVEDVPDSNSDSGSEGEGGEEPGSSGRGSLAGDKSASFARAFAKIMEAPAAKAASSEGADAAVGGAPILAASRSLAKRRAEEEADAKQDREAKRLRQEMKRRGHVVPTRRGKDPAADAREKALSRLATKGVVRLFNAVAKAQKQLREAEAETGSKAKAAKLGKASFLAELKGAAAGSTKAQPLVPAALQQGGAATASTGGSKKQQQAQRRRQQQQQRAAGDSTDEEEPGWDVLKQGFSGLQGGSKMKDWDKQLSEEEGGEDAGALGDSGSEDDGGDW